MLYFRLRGHSMVYMNKVAASAALLGIQLMYKRYVIVLSMQTSNFFSSFGITIISVRYSINSTLYGREANIRI